MPLFGSPGVWQSQERLGLPARRAVQRAETDAAARGLRQATPDILLLALLAETEGVPVRALIASGVEIGGVREALSAALGRREAEGGGRKKERAAPASRLPPSALDGGAPVHERSPLDAAAREGVILGVNEARRAGFEQAGVGHLLLGVLEARTGTGARLLAHRGARLRTLRPLIHELELLSGDDSADAFTPTFASLLSHIGGACACPRCHAPMHTSFHFCYNCGAACSEVERGHEPAT
jgi:ATP-dependent Clp protease ATP-binding subunit ClpA